MQFIFTEYILEKKKVSSYLLNYAKAVTTKTFSRQDSVSSYLF